MLSLRNPDVRPGHTLCAGPFGFFDLSSPDDLAIKSVDHQRCITPPHQNVSHAVPRHITEGLTASATLHSDSDDSLTVVEVPRFSDLEVDHVLANFEATGIGNLRLDRGDTVMDKQEVGYLKMISGSVGQKLLDAAVL